MTHSNSLDNFDSSKFNHLVPPQFHTEKYRREINSSIDTTVYEPEKLIDKSKIV